jgi:Tfp pilus assembly protein PilF
MVPARTSALALLIAVLCRAQQDAAAPTFARDVAPIVWRACSGCHRPGQPAPFALLGYDDVFRRRAKIVDATQRRAMPPWLPVAGDFADDRRLTAAEIATLKTWADAGGPRGDATKEPPAPAFASGWQLGEPDLVVQAPEGIEVPANGPDVVRNLVIPVDVEALRYVDAIEIRPGSRAVHHAILGVDATRMSRQLDAADREPGFAGMTLGGATPPDGHILGWTPGKTVRREPPGTAWRLRPGDDFVLQVHVVPTGKTEVVRPAIGLWFTETPTKTTFVPLVLYSEAIDIAPGAADFALHDHLVVPVPITVHALYPHAHYVCRRMRGTATLPDGSERVLFAIDAWDFDWQDDYRLRTPLALPAGTRIAIDYVYDNSDGNPNNPTRPAARVRFGQRSSDEMGTLTLAVAVDRADLAVLEEASVARQLEKVPNAWNVWLQRARLSRERSDFAAARASLDRVEQLAPGNADAAFERGLCAESERRAADAVAAYEEALRRDPAHGLAHLQLGTLLARDGRADDAFVHFEQALKTLPNSPIVHNNVATAHFQLGHLDDAALHYRRALALDPEYFGATFNLGRVLVRLGKRDEARPLLERAAKLRPADAAVRAELEALGR